MTNPTPLRPAGLQPHADTVEALENALALAKAGKLRAVAICGDQPGHRTYYAYAAEDNMMLIAKLAKMQHMVLAHTYEIGETPDA